MNIRSAMYKTVHKFTNTDDAIVAIVIEHSVYSCTQSDLFYQCMYFYKPTMNVLSHWYTSYLVLQFLLKLGFFGLLLALASFQLGHQQLITSASGDLFFTTTFAHTDVYRLTNKPCPSSPSLLYFLLPLIVLHLLLSTLFLHLSHLSLFLLQLHTQSHVIRSSTNTVPTAHSVVVQWCHYKHIAHYLVTKLQVDCETLKLSIQHYK